MTARNQQIVDRYQDGYSITEVGDEYGLSRERVRQLLVAAGITERHRGRHRREQLDWLVRDAFARISEGTSSTKTEAQILGIRADSLRANFRRRGLRLPLAVARHGTRHYYMQYGCRCDLCRAAVREQQRLLKEREPPAHGTASAYHNYGCRCAPCRAAGREARREQKRRRIQRGYERANDSGIRAG